jgi:TRAP-type mannitol/chloroaromatic compound transport system permease small subunit
MLKIAHFIDVMNEKVGIVSSYAAIFLMILVIFEVVSRRVLNSPTVWTFESIGMLYGFHYMMTMPYGLLTKCHVNVDIIYNLFSSRGRAYLDLISFAVFFFPFTIGVLWASIFFACQSWAELETSWSVWSPPIYPIKTVIPVAFFLLVLQGISECIKRYLFIREGGAQ